MTQVPEEYVAMANEACDAAGAVIMQYWRREFEIEEKAHGTDRVETSSPVTEADRGAEAAIRRVLASRFPTHGVVGEEFGQSPCADFGERTNFANAEWQWVLDPIDGTKSFMTGKPVFGTLVALCRHGIPVIGVIDQPVSKERWVGVVGRGTTLNGKPVGCRDKGPTLLADALAYATTPDMFAPGFETDAFLRLKSAVKRILFGCDCYAYALLASNFGPSIVCEADLQPYDYLALVPVVSQAGGIITDWSGNALTLHHTGHGRVLAATNSKLHASALAVLRLTAASPSSSGLQQRPRLLLSAVAAAGIILGFALGRATR